MATPLRIKLGCVPEHFSTPFALAIQKGYFSDEKVQVDIVYCPGGTGEMTRRLIDRSVDVAVALTEGLVACIAKGEKSFKIIGTSVESSLCWAISAGAHQTKINSTDSLKNGRIGISRFGSGSHIVPFVMADQKGWISNTKSGESEHVYDFKVLNDFKGLRDGVNNDVVDAFMWETFMTKPYHDSGEVRRIGDITPPWPAFMFAAGNDIIASNADALKGFLLAVTKASKEFANGDRNTDVIPNVRNFLSDAHTTIEQARHETGSKTSTAPSKTIDGHVLSQEDITNWFETVKYPQDSRCVSKAVLKKCVETLKRAGVIDGVEDVEDLCDTHVANLV